MVVLDPLSLGGLDVSLKAALAVTPVAGVRLVAVEDQRDQAMPWGWKGFVPFELGINVLIDNPDRCGGHAGADASHGVGAGQGGLEPAFPERYSLCALESVEASQAGKAHDQARSSNQRRGNARSFAIVGDVLQGLGE